MAQMDRFQYGVRRSVSSVRHHGALEKLTRIGFIAKGVVYSLIGVLALRAAAGNGGETIDSRGAISRIATQPFGDVLVAVIGVGLLAYAAWRLVCAFDGTEETGSGTSAIVKRAGYFFSGLFHASAGVFAFRLLTGNGSSGDNTQSRTARLMNAPGGEVLLAIAAIAVVGYGLYQVREGWKEGFRKHLRVQPSGNDLIVKAGKWGYIARGTVFTVVGFLLLTAVFRHDPSRARGFEGGLDTIAAQPWLLAFVAAGLICYGVYCFVEARYRRLHT